MPDALVADFEYIQIWREPLVRDRKTHVYRIENKRSTDEIGHIQWYGAWRQFCFVPASDTTWNRGCLEGVIEFLKELNDARMAR